MPKPACRVACNPFECMRSGGGDDAMGVDLKYGLAPVGLLIVLSLSSPPLPIPVDGNTKKGFVCEGPPRHPAGAESSTMTVLSCGAGLRERRAMKRKPFLWYMLVIGGIHFVASLLIVPLTLRVGEFVMRDGGTNMLLTALHMLTRALYFPIIGLALYPRLWFPGHWMAAPILVNSLLWGTLLAGMLMLGRRFQTGR